MIHKGWGRIVNFAGIAGKEGSPKLSAYSTSKAAVIGPTKSLGKELATTGVLVNAVAPSAIASPMVDVTPREGLEYIRSGFRCSGSDSRRSWRSWLRGSRRRK
jgi:2-dehydro-3-deoxy-L-rhamnonate dehydrogenase (NAD+)